MLRIFSLVYWAFAIATMPFYWLGASLIFLVTKKFDRRLVALQLYSCFWAFSYIVMNPLWRVRFKGRSLIPKKGAAVLVANHLSLLDILALYGLFRPFKWVSREDLFRVPFVGWNMRMNDYVPLLRGDRESIRKMMAHCRQHLSNGVPILIFPEGTRSRDGHLQPFKDGAFRLAAEAGVPVIPIAIEGTGEALPKAGLMFRRRMSGTVTVLDPIPPSADPQVLKARARSAIVAALPEKNRPLPAVA